MSATLTCAATVLAITVGHGAGPGLEQRADSAWSAGRYHAAASAYDSLLQTDPRSAKACYRIGLWLSWEGRLDSARVMVRRARALEPRDGDLKVAEARILSWDGSLSAAVALYDSVLRDDPERRDARLGRAQVLAWAGRFTAADSAYEDVLRSIPEDPEALNGRAQVASWSGRQDQAEAIYLHVLDARPENVDALVGLARLHHEQGRERASSLGLERALAIAPENQAARRLEEIVRAARRPQLETALRLSRDSDHNVVWSRSASSTMALGDGLRAFARGSSVLASDPARDAVATGGELGLRGARGRFEVTGAAGARRLSPRAALDRSAASARGIVSARVLRGTTVGFGFSRYPFDENALLMESRVDVEEWEASGESNLPGRATLSASFGEAWLSDTNRRKAGSLALMWALGARWACGVAARALEYERRGVGYFSPDRFSTAEGRGSATLERGRWSGVTRVGLGVQQVGEDAAGQFAWHADQTLRFHWSAANQIELSLGGSNSATSSTTGAYSSFTSALAIRFGI